MVNIPFFQLFALSHALGKGKTAEIEKYQASEDQVFLPEYIFLREKSIGKNVLRLPVFTKF